MKVFDDVNAFDVMHKELKRSMQFMSDEELRRGVLEQMFIFYCEENNLRRDRVWKDAENNNSLNEILVNSCSIGSRF